MDSLLANVVYQAGHQTWWATVRALGSKDPSERADFCNYPRRGLHAEPNQFDFVVAPNDVAEDEENSINDDVDEFHCECKGIANERF